MYLLCGTRDVRADEAKANGALPFPLRQRDRGILILVIHTGSPGIFLSVWKVHPGRNKETKKMPHTSRRDSVAVNDRVE